MENEKNKKVVAIVLVVLVLTIGIYNMFFKKNKIQDEKIDTKTISTVKNNSNFFTVSSCVSKYINYLSVKDTDNLLTILSKDYVSKNSINSTNIYSFIGDLNGIYEFNPKKILEQRYSKYVYKYYVHGSLEEDNIDINTIGVDAFYIVFLDKQNMTFAVEPYDGKLFK